MSFFYDLLSMGVNEDARSWVFRLAHYGVYAGALAFFVLVFMTALNAWILLNVIRLRRELRALRHHLTNISREDLGDNRMRGNISRVRE